MLAELTRILASEGISIEALIQKGSEREAEAEIVLLTHPRGGKARHAAIAQIEALDERHRQRLNCCAWKPSTADPRPVAPRPRALAVLTRAIAPKRPNMKYISTRGRHGPRHLL